jgi:probable HAF family extracellular repeat protein
MHGNLVLKLTGSAMALALCGVVAAAPSYSVKQLHPEVGEFRATAINNKAKVAAYIDNENGDPTGATCSAKTCTEVPPLQGAWPLITTSVNAINKYGHVVGTSLTDKSRTHAILFNGVETIDLGAFAYDSCGGCSMKSWARGINGKGQVVGSSETISGVRSQSFVWKAGVLTQLPTLGGASSDAFAINEQGLIAGGAEIGWLSGVRHAVIYRKGQVQDLGALGSGVYSNAYAINNLGVAVGSSTTNGWDGEVPFIYRDAQMTQLPLPAGAIHGMARGINDAGWVIGSYRPSIEVLSSGWVFDGHDVYDLNSTMAPADQAKWVIRTAVGINASGQILVEAYKPSDPAIHSLILTPKAPAH